MSGYDSSSDGDREADAAVPALGGPQTTPAAPPLPPASSTVNGAHPAAASGPHGKLPAPGVTLNGCLNGSSELRRQQERGQAPLQRSADPLRCAGKATVEAAGHAAATQASAQSNGRATAGPDRANGHAPRRPSGLLAAQGVASERPSLSSRNSSGSRSSSTSSDSISTTSASDSDTRDSESDAAGGRHRAAHGVSVSAGGTSPRAADDGKLAGVRSTDPAAGTGCPLVRPQQAACQLPASQQPGAASQAARAPAIQQDTANGYIKDSGQFRAVKMTLSLTLQPVPETDTALGIIAAGSLPTREHSKPNSAQPGPMADLSRDAATAGAASEPNWDTHSNAQPGRPQPAANALERDLMQEHNMDRLHGSRPALTAGQQVSKQAPVLPDTEDGRGRGQPPLAEQMLTDAARRDAPSTRKRRSRSTRSSRGTDSGETIGAQ